VLSRFGNVRAWARSALKIRGGAADHSGRRLPIQNNQTAFVAIQSTSALNAYLTSASSAPLTPESSVGEGALAQAGASAGRTNERRVAPRGPAETVEDVESQTDGTPADDASSVQTALSVMYGSNARSVAAGTAAGSVSYYA
jgi:hypothetical protein